MQSQPKKIALIYDHLLTRYGGAELVLDVVCSAFPTAVLYTTIHDPINGYHSPVPIRTSFLQPLRRLVSHRELLDIVTPFTLEQFDLSGYDLIISITSSAAKGIITRPGQVHICYLLTPTRYLYQSAAELQASHPILSWPLLRNLAQLPLSYLRWWDRAAAWRPDAIITISELVAERCQAYYSRTPAQIIHPPVPQPAENISLPVVHTKPYILAISRLMPYKRLDLAILAALQTEQLLCIVGTGRSMSSLQRLAGASCCTRKVSESIQSVLSRATSEQKRIIFMGSCSTAEKQLLLHTATATIMPGVEDFGITALESVAAGIPVIYSLQSGVAEVLTDQVHGLAVAEQTLTAYVTALKKVKNCSFNKEQLRTHGAQFSPAAFVRKFHNTCFAIYSEHSTMIG